MSRHAANAAAASGSQIIFATASYDHTIKFWEVHSGKSWLTIKVPDTQVNCMVLSPDHRARLACGTNPNVLLYDFDGDTSAPSLSYTGHTGNVVALGYHRDGRWLYSASEDRTVKIWDVRAAGCQREMENAVAVNGAALHPNQVELVYVDQSGSMKVWDLRTNSCSRQLVPTGKQEVPLRCVDIASNGKRVVAANNKGQCFVWRLAMDKSGNDNNNNNNDNDDVTSTSSAAMGAISQFEPYTKVDAHSTYVTSVRISPDCKYVVTASADGTAKVFDMKQFRQVQQLKGHEDWLWDAQWSADSSMVATCSSDFTAKLWSVANGEVMREYTEQTKTLSAMVLLDKAL